MEVLSTNVKIINIFVFVFLLVTVGLFGISSNFEPKVDYKQ